MWDFVSVTLFVMEATKDALTTFCCRGIHGRIVESPFGKQIVVGHKPNGQFVEFLRFHQNHLEAMKAVLYQAETWLEN